VTDYERNFLSESIQARGVSFQVCSRVYRKMRGSRISCEINLCKENLPGLREINLLLFLYLQSFQILAVDILAG